MTPFYHEGQIEVEGETLHLVCNFRCIDAIEALTGLGMDVVLERLFTRPPMSLANKVLWGMLLEKHDDITLDGAAAYGFGDHGKAVGLVMYDVLRRAFNLEPEAKGKNPPKRRGASKGS